MTCRYCGQAHEAGAICRNVSRRTFLFLGAGVLASGALDPMSLLRGVEMNPGGPIFVLLKNGTYLANIVFRNGRCYVTDSVLLDGQSFQTLREAYERADPGGTIYVTHDSRPWRLEA